MSRLIQKRANALRRSNRTRASLHGTAERPRLSISISNLHITAQLIDDDLSSTVAYASTVGAKTSGTMTVRAVLVGTEIAKKAVKAKITKVIFDRGAHAYHGRVKALADAARQGGLEF